MPGADIRIEAVGVDYAGEGGLRRAVLRGINLDIREGEFVSVVGQTGCGKSTLLRLILGEEKPTRGRVLLGSVERSQPDRQCGYVPQKYSLFPDKTVLDNVMFGPAIAEFWPFSFCSPRRRARIREVLDEAMAYLRHTGLHDSDARKYPHQLSGGMQQRVAIAQALIMKPRVLLMDEPFSALDPGTRAGMQRLIQNLWEESGTTIVFVTHDTREAVCLGSRLVVLGQNAASGCGASVAIDWPISHVDFETDHEEIAGIVKEVEARAALAAFRITPELAVNYHPSAMREAVTSGPIPK